jgi:hypothetical protein
MSTFVPDQQINDPNSPVGRYMDGLTDLVNLIGSPSLVVEEDQRPTDFLRMRDRGAAVKHVQADIDAMQDLVGGSHAAEINELRQEANQLAVNAPDALERMQSTAFRLQHSDFGRDVLNKANNQFRDNAYKYQALQLPDWQAFVDSRRTS